MDYYIGLSLAASSGMDSGVAVLDEDNKLIFLDKLYTMNDVMFFFDNFSLRVLRAYPISLLICLEFF